MKWARLTKHGPSLPKRQLSRAAKAGLTYERKVGRRLKKSFNDVQSGVWINYLDSNGFSWAQPDHFVVLEEEVLLVECKLTQNETGIAQLTGLYAPLLATLFQMPVRCVLACRNLRHRGLIIERPEERLGKELPEVMVWHWIGD